jgi:hypothetical protein
MVDKISFMPAAREAVLDPQTRKACTELLAATISLIDKQIERAEELLGTDQVHFFLRAIEAHVAGELGASSQSQEGNQS